MGIGRDGDGVFEIEAFQVEAVELEVVEIGVSNGWIVFTFS